MPLLARRPSEATLARLLAGACASPDVTYEPVGATRVRLRRPGFTFVRRERLLATDPGAFDRACAALARWGAHRGAGARIHPEDAPLVTGTTLLVSVPVLVAHAVAPCRIVYTTAEGDRFGYAYGTLPGHPEAGEESFHVERRGGDVYFVISAYFRLVHPLARLGRPVSLRVQEAMTNRYLAGLAAAVAEGAR